MSEFKRVGGEEVEAVNIDNSSSSSVNSRTWRHDVIAEGAFQGKGILLCVCVLF